jgi:hypothetical protein
LSYTGPLDDDDAVIRGVSVVGPALMVEAFEASLQVGTATEGNVTEFPLSPFTMFVVPEIQRKLRVNERSGPHQLDHVQVIASNALSDSEGTIPWNLSGEPFPWIAS